MRDLDCRLRVSLAHPALASTPVLPQPQNIPLPNTSHRGTGVPAQCWQRRRAGHSSERLCQQPRLSPPRGARLHTHSSDLWQAELGPAAPSPVAPAATGAADVAPPAAAAAEPGPAAVPSAAASSCNTCVRAVAGTKSVCCEGSVLSLPSILLQGAPFPSVGGSCMQKCNLPN